MGHILIRGDFFCLNRDNASFINETVKILTRKMKPLSSRVFQEKIGNSVIFYFLYADNCQQFTVRGISLIIFTDAILVSERRSKRCGIMDRFGRCLRIR